MLEVFHVTAESLNEMKTLFASRFKKRFFFNSISLFLTVPTSNVRR